MVSKVDRMTHRVDDTHFALFVNGQRQIYETTPEIARAINNLDAPSLNLAIKLMSVPSRMVRAGVTLDPAYMARNTFRDTVMAGVQSNYGFKPGIDTLYGLGNYLTKGETYRNWLKGGGAQSARIALDRDYAGQEFLKLGVDRTELWKKMQGVMKSPLDVLRAAQEATENATRIGAQMRAEKALGTSGDAIRKASKESRNSTQDFERVGASMQALRHLSEFTVAQIGGTHRELEALKNNPLRTTARLGLYITTPSVLLWAANRGDPRYENLPWWEKDNAWIVLDHENKDRPPTKIVKPFTAGVLAGGLPERVLTAYFDKHPEQFDDFLKQLNAQPRPIDPRHLGRDPYADIGKNLSNAALPNAFQSGDVSMGVTALAIT